LALGSALSLPVFFREVQTASASRIAEIAAELLAQARHARDDTLWALTAFFGSLDLFFPLIPQ
jgi:hypothetical protein